MTRDYYQKNRLTILVNAKTRHERNKSSLNYIKLTNYRKYLVRLRDTIEEHKLRIKENENKIKLVKDIIEALELEWGKERAALKRKDLQR